MVDIWWGEGCLVYSLDFLSLWRNSNVYRSVMCSSCLNNYSVQCLQSLANASKACGFPRVTFYHQPWSRGNWRPAHVSLPPHPCLVGSCGSEKGLSLYHKSARSLYEFPYCNTLSWYVAGDKGRVSNPCKLPSLSFARLDPDVNDISFLLLEPICLKKLNWLSCITAIKL